MENPFAQVGAALFDLDGTLIRTELDFGEMCHAMRVLAGKYGVAVDPALRDILAIVEEARAAVAARGDAAQATALRKEAFAVLEEIEARQCRNRAVIAGAQTLLHLLREQSVRIGIVTRNSRRVSEDLVRWGKLPHDALVTRDDVERAKPHPDHLIYTLGLLGITPHASGSVLAVMIGDHWMDVQAGQAAGVRTVGILLGRDEAFYAAAKPDLLVNELGDLLVFVRGHAPALHRVP